MSRNGPGSRFNISKPRPVNTPPQQHQPLPDYDFLGSLGGFSDSPYPSMPPSNAAYASDSAGSISGNRAGVGAGAGAGARFNAEPVIPPRSDRPERPDRFERPERPQRLDRPERSERPTRPAPPPPSAGSLANSVASANTSMSMGNTSIASEHTASPLRPARSQRRSQAAPIQSSLHVNTSLQSSTASASQRPSNGVSPGSLGLAVRNIESAEITPVTPTSPVGTINAPQGSPGDPWAAEREQRSQARQYSKDTAYAAAASQRSAGASTDKLRSAVGAFMASKNRADSDPARRTPRRKMTVTKPSPKESWDDILGGPTGGKFAEIDAVMRQIRKDWPFVLEGDFSAASLALSLLSETPSRALPPHPDLQAFMEVHGALSTALQTAVQSHFQTFAASLPTHATFIATLERAMAQIKTSREALKDAREGISGKGKAELASVRNRERMVREMLQILDLIDELKQVPEQLEGHVAEKRFLQAALLLVWANKTINREDVREVGAMSDLRQYFISQESALTDILIEELHNHIYLKTINNESRWRTYAPGQHSLPVIETSPDLSKSQILEDTEKSRFSQYLSNLAIKPNQEPILNELNARKSRSSTAMRNTTSITSLSSLTYGEATGDLDSFAYMESLLEALGALGRLGQALDTLVQRVPSEIHTLIENTMEEVDDRAEQRAEEMSALAAVRPQQFLLAEKHDLESMPLFDNDTLRVVLSLDGGGPPKHAIVLLDLFWTLFSKLAAVMEGHRAVYEVSRWIASRRDFKDMSKSDRSLNVPVLEVWRPVQQEVRSLLQGYLKDESQGSLLSQSAIPSINEVLREGRFIRDRQRELFKFGDSDSRAVNSEIKELDEALKQTLRASVPGLINLQAGEANVISGNGTSEDRYSVSGSYRTLIPANAFNVTVLFEPTLAFIERATTIVPPGFEDEMSQFGTVLEEFVKSVFLPQLDEKVTASFQHAVSGSDAFQLDKRPIIGLEKPPLKSSVRVMSLIQSLCIMLQETPFHRENYSRLVVGVVVQYYQQLHSRFKELVTLSGSEANAHQSLPSVWAQREDVAPLLTEIQSIPLDNHNAAETASLREIKLELALLSGQSPRETQLLNSNRRLESLGNLANSMRWFMASLLDLQQLADEDELDNPQARVSEPGEAPRLPLTPAMSESFEALVHTYEQLIEMTLNTLHLEVRCRVLCNLSASLKRPDQRLESEAFEPDPDVVDLNTTLMEMDGIASRTLSAVDKSFMFRGLATLIDHLFVSAARDIKVINTAGAHKIRRNILSLQQTLRGIISTDAEGMLLRATAFWGLFELGPKKMLASIDTTHPMFSFDDYNAMLALQCKQDPEDKESSELNAYLIDLHAVAMQVDDWDMM